MIRWPYHWSKGTCTGRMGKYKVIPSPRYHNLHCLEAKIRDETVTVYVEDEEHAKALAEIIDGFFWHKICANIFG